MKSQKEISFEIISSLRNEGKSDSQIILEGSIILFQSWKKGEWKKEKGDLSDNGIIKYSRDLLKNWIKKDPRLNDGKSYIPKNPRGSRENQSPDYGKILSYLKEKDPQNPLIQELEGKLNPLPLEKIG